MSDPVSARRARWLRVASAANVVVSLCAVVTALTVAATDSPLLWWATAGVTATSATLLERAAHRTA